MFTAFNDNFSELCNFLMKTFVLESLIMKELKMVVRKFLIKHSSVLLNLNYCSVCFDMQQWFKPEFMTQVKKGIPIFFAFHKFGRDLNKYVPLCCIFWSSKSASHAVYWLKSSFQHFCMFSCLFPLYARKKKKKRKQSVKIYILYSSK